MHHVNARCPWRLEEGMKCPGTGVAEGCEPPPGSWETDCGPFQEQQVQLTTEPAPHCLFWDKVLLCHTGWRRLA